MMIRISGRAFGPGGQLRDVGEIIESTVSQRVSSYSYNRYFIIDRDPEGSRGCTVVSVVNGTHDAYFTVIEAGGGWRETRLLGARTTVDGVRLRNIDVKLHNILAGVPANIESESGASLRIEFDVRNSSGNPERR